MINEIIHDAEARMSKSLDALGHDLVKIRTGRAHTSLLDHIRVAYYGSEVPLNQVANVGVEDARTLLVTPWETSMVKVVEKAILNSDLGLNPNTAGSVMRIPLPPLTEERRHELTRVVHAEGEHAKVAVRNIRRDANKHLKELVDEKEISEDAEHHAEDQVQKLTDQHVSRIDTVIQEKNVEIMAV